MKPPFHYYWLTAFFSIIGVGAVIAASIRVFPYVVTLLETPMGVDVPTNSVMKITGISNPSGIATTTGTVTNTQKLGGISASEFVTTGETCSDTSKVWIGVDASGNPICGTKPTKNLTQIGTITRNGGKLTLYQSSGAILTNPPANTKIYQGDIVSTDATGTGSIKFLDESFIRLSTGTTVELSPSASASGTLASVILANGTLWGRILSSTGSYDIGTEDGGIVAAVRGTSLSAMVGGTSSNFVYMSGAWTYTVSNLSTPLFAVVDSRLGANAVKLTCNGTQTANLSTPEKGDNIARNCTTLSKQSVANLYTSYPWIRENTRKDLAYMANKTDNPLIAEERILTLPNSAEYDPLCMTYKGTSNGTWYPDIQECVYAYANYMSGTDIVHVAKSVAGNNDGVIARKYANYTNSPFTWTDKWTYTDNGLGTWDIERKVGTGTDMPNGTYEGFWKNNEGDIISVEFTIGTNGFYTKSIPDKFMGLQFTIDGDILRGTANGIGTDAMSCLELQGSISSNQLKNYDGYCTSSENWTVMDPPVTSEGITITQAGQYVEYPTGTWTEGIAGKTMVVNLGDPVTNVNASRYVLDGGNIKFLTVLGGLKKKIGNTETPASSTNFAGGYQVNFNVPSSPTLSRFILGNNIDLPNLDISLHNTVTSWYIQ